jgi:two-component system, OmpR family, sensor histidine kinase CpxA
MKARASISVKILLLALLNVLLLGLVFVVFVRIQYRVDLGSLLLSPGRDRILAVSRLVALQLPDTDRAAWDRLLAGYRPATGASACLFSQQGAQLAGPATTLPPAVLEMVRRNPFEPPEPRPRSDNDQRPSGHRPPPPPFPPFLIKTVSPTRYWVGVYIPVRDMPMTRPSDGTLVWTFPSLWTNPFFFDYKPWLGAALAVILVSAVCWLPLIRGLTRSISQITAATGAIAEGKLETRLSINRRDELGQLSEAINRMTERLSGFVHGQRRFLSDIAHELCSPIARIQVALGILDHRAQENQKSYVADVQEEVEHMSGLVNELLLFSRAQISASATPLTRVNLAETVSRVLERESVEGASIETRIDGRIEVMAQPDYLFRSLANVVRNAVRYAGGFGLIEISAENRDGMVSITVADQGPGLPEAELEEVFKPFYRPELARQRETGGTGLGLAIVRTCIEACGGAVECHNRSPKGLEVVMRLAAP